MNVYDFDKTIYNGDSTCHFYFYCLKKYPVILKYLPFQAFSFFLYIIGIYTKTEFKERFYRFFKSIKDTEYEAELFWQEKQYGIKEYYKLVHQTDDVVISASPEFLLRPICKKLGISTLIASKVDPKSGKYDGENCYGEQKVLRFKNQMGDIAIKVFCSDSLSDAPLANLAQNSYIVSGEELIEWEKYNPGKIKKFIKTIICREFLSFGIIGLVNTVDCILFSWLYSLVCPANLAFSLGYITSLLFSYIMNSYLTFKDSLSFVKLIKFFVSYIPNYIIQNVIVFIVYNLLEMDKLIAYILAGIIGVPITFVMMRIFVFRKKENKKDCLDKFNKTNSAHSAK